MSHLKKIDATNLGLALPLSHLGMNCALILKSVLSFFVAVLGVFALAIGLFQTQIWLAGRFAVRRQDRVFGQWFLPY
ncbi:hypothetical protein JCM19053_2583 [Vibrio sp. JCM 19053]|nr:hypothetical protein JCM19053_2583 [Vibrio sp. JCM 19053]